MYGCVELVAALEEVEFEDENVADEVSSESRDQFTGCGCGTAWKCVSMAVVNENTSQLTGSDYVVYNQNFLTLLNPI